MENTLYSLEEVGTLFTTQLPQFQDPNLVVGCIRPWVSWPVGSGCHFPAARSCQLHCSFSGTLPASTRLHSDGWRRSAEGDAKSHICGSVLSSGFSSNQYRWVRMGKLFMLFWDLQRKGFAAGWAAGKRGLGFHVCGFLCLVMVVCRMLSYNHFPASAPGLNLIVYQLSRLGGLLCSAGLPSGCCTLTLYGHEHQTMSMDSISFLLLFHLLCSPWFAHFQMSQCE